MKKLFLISLLVLFIHVAFAQTRTITGTVKIKQVVINNLVKIKQL